MARRDWPPEQALNWTPRQREVLQLIAAGRTNAEIARTLGVSLAGAKWHVSEVISKLGVSSREEAAQYWREANSVGARFSRGMAALAGVVTLKAAAGAVLGVAGVGAAAIGVMALAGMGSGQEAPVAAESRARSLPLDPTSFCRVDWDESVIVDTFSVSDRDVTFRAARDNTGDDPGGICFQLTDSRLTGNPVGFRWDADEDGYPIGCLTMSGTPGYRFCSAAPEVAYAIVEGQVPMTAVDATPLPPELGTELKYLFVTGGADLDSDIFYFDATGEMLHVNRADPKWQGTPNAFGPPPAITEHITAISPAHGATISHADAKAGVCADASFEGLPEQGTWFRMYLDGADVTQLGVWVLDSRPPTDNGRLCYASGPEPGPHTATVEVRDPKDPSAPALESVTWSFVVVLPGAPPTPPGVPPTPTLTPAPGATISQATARDEGFCMDGEFEKLTLDDRTEKPSSVSLKGYLDGDETRGTLAVDLGPGPDRGRLCILSPVTLDLGSHTLTVEVRDPAALAGPPVETVSWSFEVVP